MKPLSLKTRRIFSGASFLLLIIILPIALLYASGYRLDGTSLAPTGGIFVITPHADVSISINGIERKRSGIFARSFLIDSLDEGLYVVQTGAPGYYPWSKNVYVKEGLVTDVSATMVPQPLEVKQLVTRISSGVDEETVLLVSASELAAFDAAFTIASTTATSTEAGTPDDTYRGYALTVFEGDVLVSWTRSPQSIPSAFCEAPFECVPTFVVEDWGQTVERARFYESGIIMQFEESGIFFSDIDARPPIFLIPLYPRAGSEFRIVDGRLIIKDGSTFYSVVGF